MADVGQSLSFKWPSGDTTLALSATVRAVEESEKVKHGSKYVYTLDCSDGQVRKTRLLNLEWSLDQSDRKRQRDEKKNQKSNDSTDQIEGNTKSSTGGDVSTKKKKARWTDGRNASTDTIEKTVYVKQIPYAASSKDIEKHFGSNVSNVRLLKDENKKSRGIAFIEFNNNNDAIAALGLQGSILQGRPISVSKCIDKETARSQDKARIELKEANQKEEEEEEKQKNAHLKNLDSNKLDLEIIKSLTSNCIRSSHGSISNDDFDSRSIEFMRSFNEDILKEALKEFANIPLIKDKKVANKASYLMGVLKRFQAGKARPKKGEGSVASTSTSSSSSDNTNNGDGSEKKKLVAIESSTVEIETCITNAILQSEGKLTRSDFDSRHVSFLQELPLEKASAACDEFASYYGLNELRNKGSYFMGILRRHSNGDAAPPPKTFGKGKGKGGKGEDGKGGKGKGGKGGKGKGDGKGKGKGKGKGGKGKGKGKGKGY